MAKVGLLLREKQGNQVRYRANRDCPVFPELAGLFRKTTGLANILTEALQPCAGKIEAAWVFGSVARGEETANSDVDLLIVGQVSFAEAVKALHPAQARLTREINPVVISRAELQQRIQNKDPFIQQIFSQPAIPVIGDAHDLGQPA